VAPPPGRGDIQPICRLDLHGLPEPWAYVEARVVAPDRRSPAEEVKLSAASEALRDGGGRQSKEEGTLGA
jgi:hypothetical protein